MEKLSKMHWRSNTKSWNKGGIQEFKWRLDLVYRYKMYFDSAANFSRDQIDFISGLMHPKEMMSIELEYKVAIINAIEIAQAEDQRIREERLIAAANRASGPQVDSPM
jgi:hypothetical protein